MKNCIAFNNIKFWKEQTQSQSYVTTDGQSVSLSWNEAPIWDLLPDFYYCRTVAGLLMWGALSDLRTGLSFTIAADPRQRTHSPVWVPWDSRPYFTVSDSRLHFSSPPTTRRVMVKILAYFLFIYHGQHCYQLLNVRTSLYETLYVYHSTWFHLSGVLHKSFPSVCVSICIYP
jgi:hypothetical protein